MTSDDVPLVRHKAQVLASTMYPELIPDIDKMHWLLRESMQSTNHYAHVVGAPGEPGAALIARTSNNLWALRRHASILLWYSEIPGAGAKLLRHFRNWVKEQGNSIVLAGFSSDWIVLDDRPLKLASRAGFKQRGEGMYAFYPRGPKV